MLHNWHGPYQIVDQPHELNFAVKRPKCRKIEIIHVKDKKKYAVPNEERESEEYDDTRAPRDGGNEPDG